jgi:cytochrome c oxidase cbb3-type subunit 3
MAGNRDVLLDHSIDGIQEYDNPLPTWWLGIFYFTIAFAIVFVPYLWIAGWDQESQYDAEVAAAEVTYGAVVAEQRAALAAAGPTPEMIAAGQAIYAEKCVACHMADATGGIGPDLTDAEWIHGGTLPEINTTVREGVVEKGMLAWGPLIGEEGVAQVSAYVHSLGGGR